jgi:hypothetical protein
MGHQWKTYTFTQILACTINYTYSSALAPYFNLLVSDYFINSEQLTIKKGPLIKYFISGPFRESHMY